MCQVKSTAEHTWALLLSITRNLQPAIINTKNKKKWDRNPYLADELNGKNLGIIGYGRLGKIVAEYGHAFGMNVIVNDIDDKVFNKKKKSKPYHHSWIMGLPVRMRFKKSGLYISIIPPLTIGFIVGILASIMGVGGGFIMIPAMIYILRMPTSVVIGTSLYQIIFVTAIVTLLHSYHNQTVDIILALILLLGGAIGAQIGVKLSSKLEGPMLRASLAILVLSVGIVMASDLLVKPDETITLLIGGGSH